MAQARLKTSDWIALGVLAGLLPFTLQFAAVRPEVEALAVTIVFALGGWKMRGVSGSGAIAGGLVSFALYSRGGLWMFAALFCVFALTWAATQAGYARKEQTGLAESRGGRTAVQVAANLLVAYASVIFLPPKVAVIVAFAGLAEAAADTVSSEIGKGFAKQVRLITNLRPIPAGTNGGVSWIGTWAGVGAAIAVSATGFALLGVRGVALASLGGVCGMMVDSLLGATLEQRRLLNNDAVNLLGTASAAAVTGLMLDWAG